MVLSKWQAFEFSIFPKMSQLAAAHQAVNLAQGFPNFDGPDELKEAALQAMRQGHNQYAPPDGVVELREGLAQFQKQQCGMQYDPISEITVFSGATEAIFCTITGLCEAGDEVVTFEPFYDSYPVAAMVAGAKVKTVRLKGPNWEFDPNELKAAITTRTKLLILNTPHNPTGKVFKRDELLLIAKLAQEHNFLVMTDEVYEQLVFPPARHISLAGVPGMRERTILVSSTSKSFSMTGWKIGYAFAPAELTRAIRIPHQYTVFCSATPLQYGMIPATKMGTEYFTPFRDAYAERRAALFKILREHGFQCQQPEGSYFIVADYKNILDIPDLEFAEWLTREVEIACIPLSSFYSDPHAARDLRYVRFAFCKDLETIKKAGENFQKNLKPALDRYKSR